jgi:hypothetical protein
MYTRAMRLSSGRDAVDTVVRPGPEQVSTTSRPGLLISWTTARVGDINSRDDGLAPVTSSEEPFRQDAELDRDDEHSIGTSAMSTTRASYSKGRRQ